MFVIIRCSLIMNITNTRTFFNLWTGHNRTKAHGGGGTNELRR